ncbi:kanamycin kinase [Rugamonas rubra]|uniref:Aminoglycoside 3'-phosphotransferase n=2 Tax=Rugamonas rubra TaxID=758825 RepID=A0A1I4T9U3_9BURK|nr:kanamycin kinase [Rugamonas rubra]
MPFHLPPEISRFIGDAPLRRDAVGESPCPVNRFQRGNDVFFLKTSAPQYAPTSYSVAREADVLRWLSGRLRVPELVCVARHEGYEHMITRTVPGVPLSLLVANDRAVSDLFLEAVRLVQSVPVADCPFDSSTSVRLRELDYLLGKDLVADDYDLLQWPGLATPPDLQARLKATVPPEDLVFSHGDLGDINVFVDAREELYFIDLGRGGRADRWLDITFIHRNLREEVSASAAADFLARLGLPDAPAKREFFEQLDELF